MLEKYVFSESANLLCEIKGKTFSVINGAWDGVQVGDKFFIGSSKEDYIVIKDWLEIVPSEMPIEWQEAYYYRRTT